MPGGSKKGHAQGAFDIMAMKLAVRDVLMHKKSQKSVAKEYGVARQTLRRYIAKAADGYGVEKSLGRKSVLTGAQENELSNYLQSMEASLYGLTPMSVRRIVYKYCQENGISHPFNHETQIAGRKWFRQFMARHKELSVRTPEPVSIQRAIGFNEGKVNIFFNLLEKALFAEDLGTRRIPPENVFNVDETGLSICHKPHKIVARRGKKNVGGLTSAERGKNTTIVCCFSATGQYVPPFIIFPRVRMKASLLDSAPSGAVGRATKSGWINEELFAEWFEHFLATVQPQSRTSPVLLLADGHSSHTNNLSVVTRAREHNVEILIFPSHCTHKLQPCDVSFFKSLKWHYDDRAANWLMNHPGRAVNEEEMVKLFADAYGKAATIANAISGFAKTGIHPFDKNKFQGQYDAAAVTNRDIPERNTDFAADLCTVNMNVSMAVRSDALDVGLSSSSPDIGRMH
jgi:transposase